MHSLGSDRRGTGTAIGAGGEEVRDLGLILAGALDLGVIARGAAAASIAIGGNGAHGRPQTGSSRFITPHVASAVAHMGSGGKHDWEAAKRCLLALDRRAGSFARNDHDVTGHVIHERQCNAAEQDPE
jgi:hypothetical protein